MSKAIVEDQVVDYISETPHAVYAIIFSSFSGQLWSFLIITYFKSGQKGNELLLTIYAKIALGFCWFSLVLVPIYLLYFHNFNFDYNNIIKIIIPTIQVGLALQVIFFIFCLKYGKEKE